MPLQAGGRLGSYVVVQLLGAGGMGEVYRGRDERLGRDVALKVLAPHLAQDRDALARFEREAKAASALNHPHIVNIYEIGEAETPTGPARYIAMEFVAGETLRARLKAGARWRSLVEPLTQVADALAMAHKAGIVHRDLKPENVVITSDGYPKIVDFGLAKLTPAEPMESQPTAAFEARTKTGMILGTPGYMSPEQVQGKPVDSRSDIFSLGCIVYEAATGRPPFKGESSVATLHAIVYEEPAPIESLSADAPAELRRIVARCLAKDTAQRYQAMKEVGADLRALARTGATPSPGSEPTRALATGNAAAPPHRRWLVRGAVAVALGVAAVVGFRLAMKARPARPGSSAIQVEKLTSRGNVHDAAVSPDGRYLAYTVKEEEGRRAIWLRDIAEKTERRLVRGETAWLDFMRFSMDGRAVYYSFETKGDYEHVLYKVPLIGGEPRLVRAATAGYGLSPDERRLAFRRKRDGKDVLVVADVDSGQEREIGVTGEWNVFAWSPDGSQLVFERRKDERSSLFVIQADGTLERKVAELDQVLEEAWWKPDGKGVLCFVRPLHAQQKEVRIVELDLANGATRPIGDHVWGYVQSLSWLPDASGFVVEVDAPGKEGEAIWRVSYPAGTAERIPADTHAYTDLGITADGTKLVAIQTSFRGEILVSPNPETGSFRKIASGTDVEYTLCWTADGKIVSASNEAGSYDLYVSDPDGSNRKPLTFDRTGNEIEPAASPDGRYIVFSSDRPGGKGIYRIGRDGMGLRRLTSPTDDQRDIGPQVTPDSQWVVYTGWHDGPKVRKVPIDGGAPVLITGAKSAALDEFGFGAAASPNGKHLAFFYFSRDGSSGHFSATDIAISALNGAIVKRLPFPEWPHGAVRDNQRVQWSRDGATLYYESIKDGMLNLWKRPVSGGSPVQVTHFEEKLEDFEWSLDGKTLAGSRRSQVSDVVLITNFR